VSVYVPASTGTHLVAGRYDTKKRPVRKTAMLQQQEEEDQQMRCHGYDDGGGEISRR